MHNPIDPRLAKIRGMAEPRPHNARTLAALANNPGCQRRAVLDAAGIDKLELASQIGFQARFGQSPFAIARGVTFEARLKEQECSGLVDLLREVIGLEVAGIEYVNCEKASADESREQRSTRSAMKLVQRASCGPGNLTIFDHPLLALDVAGTSCYLEPDLVLVHEGDFRLVEIKSFAVIDGQADGGKVAAAAIQSAAYLLALRQTLSTVTARAGAGALPESSVDRVCPEVVLVCPENFSNQPTATVIDLRKQLIVLEHQLRRLARIEGLLARLPEDLSLDPTTGPAGQPRVSAKRLRENLERLSAHYRPECLEYCELTYFCRDEASGSTAALGASVRETLGGLATVAEVLGLANGSLRPHDDQEAIAELLRAAAVLYAEGTRSDEGTRSAEGQREGAGP